MVAASAALTRFFCKMLTTFSEVQMAPFYGHDETTDEARPIRYVAAKPATIHRPSQ